MGMHSSPRGRRASKFGWDVTAQFCARNNLDLIVTSHQTKKGGFGFDVMHDNMLIRVFTARDYEKNDNDGAILYFAESDLAPGVYTVRAKMVRALTKETGADEEESTKLGEYDSEDDDDE